MNHREEKTLLSLYENKLRKLGIVDKQIRKWLEECSMLELKERCELAKALQPSPLKKAKLSKSKPPATQETKLVMSRFFDEEAILDEMFRTFSNSTVDIQDLIGSSRSTASFSFSSQPVTKIPRVRRDDVVIDVNTDKKSLNKNVPTD
ncbi:hypothetical protein CGH72_23250 [Vibrio parahaemolyticus]|uniref:hypothetical protein n=1 Tax=Vibrio parahaemolyticus TaxID=670 RepID=UPI0011209754|nr:hypothetical protein [Vibrio parahaemolyticus]TOM64140.1 hypothetical protein CGH75_01715 [Vibrio parahaemolyticus]TOM64406.1 hypothetical protein CGH73_22460 [Vibrio parahaemolyticus]TOM65971.1 hypothetical protein CGH72_23250 [Vibrio parahaemolyticus]TOO90004.1 hypothetical protein CGH29_03830 [Vibrio parahaemolyticus]